MIENYLNNCVKNLLAFAGQFLTLISHFHFEHLIIFDEIVAQQELIANVELSTERIDFYLIICVVLGDFS